MNGVNSLGSNQECRSVTNFPTAEYLNAWQVLGNLEIAEILRDYIASTLKGNKFVYSYHPDWGYRNEPKSQASMWLMQKVL